MKEIAVYGAGGHGRVVADIARLNGYNSILFVDDELEGFMSFDEFLNSRKSIPLAFGIGDNFVRSRLHKVCIGEDIEIKTLIHPDSTVSESAIIAEGVVVMAGVVINTDAVIGKCSIINTSSVLEHDTMIGDYVHISPHTVCAGGVKIGNYTHVGAGSCIIQNIEIGPYSMIGAGSVVVKDIGKQLLAYGNPCRVIKEIDNE